MKVILLGTGGPRPDPNRQGPCLAIQINRTYLLFDAGRGAATQLARAGISVRDIHSLFITHHHFDHIGNLADVILSGWNLRREIPLSIYGPDGTEAVIDILLNEVYKRDIDFRLKEAEVSGAPLIHPGRILIAKDMNTGLIFENEEIRVSCEFVRHGHGLGISREEWKCLAYRVEAEGKSVTISGDTVDCKGLDALAKNTDTLVMCCYLSKSEEAVGSGGLISEHILAGPSQVGKIASKANAKRLILTHIREKDGDAMKEVVEDIKADFDGEIIPGRDLMEISV